MKNIVSIVLSISFLAMGSTLANAQNSSYSYNNSNSNANNAAAPVSRQELQQVQSQVKAYGRAIKGVKGDVRTLKGDVTDLQTKQIEPLSSQMVNQGVTIVNMGNAQNGLSKSVTSARKTLSALMLGWAVSCGFAMLLAIFGGYGFYLLKKRMIQGQEELKKKIAEAENAPKQVVYVVCDKHDNLPELRKAWKNLREEDPTGPLVLQLEKKVTKDPAKGFTLEGTVPGYSATFDDEKPLDNQIPKVFYGEKRVPYREMGAHAAKVLEEAQPGASTQPTAPITDISQHRTPIFKESPLPPQVPDPTFGGLIDDGKSFLSANHN